MLNLMCQIDWTTAYLDICLNITSEGLVRKSMNEINIWISRVIKVDSLYQYG
jgi:hypothetical protein